MRIAKRQSERRNARPLALDLSASSLCLLLLLFSLHDTVVLAAGAGLSNIAGTTRKIIGLDGGVLRVPDDPDYLYTKHQVLFPTNALTTEHEFVIDAPEDLGNSPIAPWSIAWLTEHPGNCSIVQIRTTAPITLLQPAVLTVQFVDDGPTTYGFTIDDVPPGADVSSMRIHTWTGASWQLLEGEQTVAGDTVSANISSLGTVAAPSGTSRMSIFAVAPIYSWVSRAEHWTLYR